MYRLGPPHPIPVTGKLLSLIGRHAARERNARRECEKPLFAAWECARDVIHAYRNSNVTAYPSLGYPPRPPRVDPFLLPPPPLSLSKYYRGVRTLLARTRHSWETNGTKGRRRVTFAPPPMWIDLDSPSRPFPVPRIGGERARGEARGRKPRHSDGDGMRDAAAETARLTVARTRASIERHGGRSGQSIRLTPSRYSRLSWVHRHSRDTSVARSWPPCRGGITLRGTPMRTDTNFTPSRSNEAAILEREASLEGNAREEVLRG